MLPSVGKNKCLLARLDETPAKTRVCDGTLTARVEIQGWRHCRRVPDFG